MSLKDQLVTKEKSLAKKNKAIDDMRDRFVVLNKKNDIYVK